MTHRFLAYLLSVFFLSCTAHAEDGTTHRSLMDYDGSFRVMGQTDEESDSDCIGDMRTLLCAFDTFVAALERGDGDLMDIVRGKTDPKYRKPFVPKYGSKMGYRILSVRLFSQSDVPAPQFNKFKIEPWDVAILFDTCNVTYGPCENLVGEIGSDSSALSGAS